MPLLAERFMHELSREYGKPPKRLVPDCLTALKAYDWPGNIRELGNVMERLLLFAGGDAVGVEDLPEGLGGARAPAQDLYGDFDSLEQGMRAFERYYIQRVLAQENGDQATAAKRLGLTRRGLSERLKRIG